MNKISSAMALCFLIVLAACAKDAVQSTNPAVSNNTLGKATSDPREYRFTGTNSEGAACDTYQRNFATPYDMCLSIQIDELNQGHVLPLGSAPSTSCALTQRQAFFDQNCRPLHFEWNQQADYQLKNTNGKYVTCELSELNQPTVIQFTSHHTMMIQHTTARGVVRHSLRNGRYQLRVDLFDVSNNRLIGSEQRTWVDEASPELLVTTTELGTAPTLKCRIVDALNQRRNSSRN